MSIRLSVVIATYNRGAALAELLGDLAHQSVGPQNFEVVIVDDGSLEPAEQHTRGLQLPYASQVVRQQNAGPAAARDRGVRLAQGQIIVITDDDMRLDKDFLAQHLAAHDAGAQVVLGNICPAKTLAHLPIFERFHAQKLDEFAQGVAAKTQGVLGISVCTVNVSFRRDLYVQVGGFDKSLGRSEDRELGVRFEKAGATLVFCSDAKTIHESDHSDLQVWMRRAYNYGIYDRRIAIKHPEVETADPWRFYFIINPLSRLLVLVPIAAPKVGSWLSRLVIAAAIAVDTLGYEQVAIKGTTLCYGLEYFRGVRAEAGSIVRAAGDVRRYLRKRRGGGGGI